MKKCLKTGVIILLVGCITFTGTKAFMTDEANQPNRIRVGWLSSFIEENFPDHTAKTEDALAVITKQVSVKNAYSVPGYVRVSLEFSNSDYKATLSGLNTTDWVYKDGWYYYKTVVGPGDTTSNLIEGIIIPKKENYNYKYVDNVDSLDVIVNEETISAEHGDTVFSTYEEAWNFHLNERGA